MASGLMHGFFEAWKEPGPGLGFKLLSDLAPVVMLDDRVFTPEAC